MRSTSARPLRATRRTAAVRSNGASATASPSPFSPTTTTSHASPTAPSPTSRPSHPGPHHPAAIPFPSSPALAVHERPAMPASPAKRLKLSTLSLPARSQQHTTHANAAAATSASTAASRQRQLIHATPALSLALHSFMPEAALRMYQDAGEVDEDESGVTGRVTGDGWCVALKDDAAVVWRAHDHSSTPVAHSVSLPSTASDASLLLPLSTASDALRLLAVTDDGDVCYWISSSNPSTASTIHQLSLARDETCTCAALLPAWRAAADTASIAVGTSQGRVLHLQLDISPARPRVINASESARKGSAVWCSLASVGRMFHWSKAAEQVAPSDAEVVSLVWYHTAEKEGVFALTRDMLCQYSLADEQVSLLYSSTLEELAPGEHQLRLVSMSSSSSSLHLLFQRSTMHDSDTDVTTHIATYPTNPAADPPVGRPTIQPLPAAVDGAVGIGVCEREERLVHVRSKRGVAVLNAAGGYGAPAVFTFGSAVVLGGGMQVGRSMVRDSSALPAFDNARCLLLCAGYGVVEVGDGSQRQADEDDLSASVNGLSLQQRRADAESAEGVLSVAFYLHRHGQTLASKMRIDDAWESQLLPSTASSQLDTTLVHFAHSLINSPASTSATADRTPELLLDDLTTKQQQLSQYLHFLHANKLYDLLSVTARVELLTAGEQLAGLAGVRRLLNMFPDSRLKSDMEYVTAREQVMLAVMRGCAQRRHGQAAAGGLSQRQVSQQFFGEVTALGDVFDSIAEVVARECRVEATDSKDTRRDKTYALQAINTVVDTLLSEAARYRTEQSGQHAMPPSTPLPLRWLVRPSVRAMLRQHCERVSECISTISASAPLASLRVDLFQYLLRIARSLLLEYGEYLASHRADKALNAELDNTRTALINMLRASLPADQGSRRDVLYDFAAEFQAFTALISLADEESEDLRESRLVAYLQHFGGAFAGVLFEVYRANGCTSRLLSIHQPAEYDEWLLAFLQRHRKDGGWDQADGEVEWVEEVELGRWEQASETLIEVAKRAKALDKVTDGRLQQHDDVCTWSQQQTLWSLSKLGLLCEDDVSEDDPRLIEVNNALDVSIAQAYAADRDISQPLLSPELLIDRLLAVQHSRRRAVAADLPNLPPVRHHALQEDMVSYYQAVEVYTKALYPLSRASDRMAAEELLVLEKVWYALYGADAEALKAVMADWQGSASDVWRSEVAQLHFYAMWQHLQLYDWYGRKEKFELSYEHFVQQQIWRRNEGDREAKQMQEVLKSIPQLAGRE